MEPKALICLYLTKVLRLTNAFKGLVNITYDDRYSRCICDFVDGEEVNVNVGCDSGFEMIKDILRVLEGKCLKNE